MSSDARPWRASQVSCRVWDDAALHGELTHAFTRALIQMINYDEGVVPEPFGYSGLGQHPATGVFK